MNFSREQTGVNFSSLLNLIVTGTLVPTTKFPSWSDILNFRIQESEIVPENLIFNGEIVENKNIPKTMENVCQKLFGGDFGAMVCYAKAYKEGERKNLGVEFRAIVGSRNRENFWRRVRELGETNDPECITIDGDSIRDLAKAFVLCKQGVEIKIQLGGKVIGILRPE